MGERGPDKLPTNVLRLRGETRPSRINDDEPQPAPTEPVMPDWLDADGIEVWNRTCRELRTMQLLYAADADTLAVYCQAVVNHRNAVKLVQGAGLVVRGRDGNVVKNPAVQMVRDFGAQVKVLAAAFGLTPSSRTGLTVGQKPGDSGPGAERLLS